MPNRVGRIARFATSLFAVVALIFLVPVGLLIATRHRFGSPNPLAKIPLPWQWSVGDALDTVSSPLTDDAVINLLVRSALVVVWISIAVIVVTTALEMAHLVRHRGMAMPSIRGLGWAQPLARTLAAGLLVLVPLSTPRASLSASGPPRAAAPLAVADIGADTALLRRAAPPADSTSTPSAPRSPTQIRQTPGRHIVQRGESIYGIAEALARDVSMTTAEIADRILDTNLDTTMVGGQHFTNPAYIEVGWELVIPADVLPATRSAPSPPNLPPMASRGDATHTARATRHLVVPGDTLSGIAEQHLGDANAWPVVFDENAGREMSDGRKFTDPHLIVPGWTIDIPQSNADGSQRSQAGGETVFADHPDAHFDHDIPAIEVTPSRAVDEAAADDAAPLATHPESNPSHSGRSMPPPDWGTPTRASTTPTTSITPDPPPDDPAPITPEERPAPSAPAPIRVQHAALLAAGVLALVGMRRRQRLRAASSRARVPEPPAEVIATERRLRTVDPSERSTRVDVAIRAVAHELIDTDVQIGIVLLSPAGDIELRLTAPAHIAPPWQAVDETEQSWELPASVPVEILGAAARRVGTPCVALVQLGVTEDRDILIDVEACGTLSVAAAPRQADEVVTALATGLATSPYAEIAHLITVSLAPAAVLGHRNAHHAESPSAALELADLLVGHARPDHRSTFSLRSLRTGGEMWEPAIVLVSTGDHRRSEDLPSSLPPAGQGIGLVVATHTNELIEAPARLTGRSDGWTLSAFGQALDLTPVGLSDTELANVANLVNDAATALITEDLVWADDQPDPIAKLDAGVTRNGFEPRSHDIVVRLMGGVEVASADGRLGSFERSKTVELVAWLATHRASSTRTAARTALWQLDVRDATFANVVSEARRALGRLVTPPGDDEWLARTLTEQLPLHEGVVTDTELMEERLQAARLQSSAQAIETLRPAAELIRDMPFAGTSYLWPDAEGLTSNFVLLATGIASELAGHALSLGDTDLVFWATGQGLKVLAGHEELIGLRMRAHASAGDLAGVRQEWESYERVIVADAWSDGEPAPKLLALRHELLTPSRD